MGRGVGAARFVVAAQQSAAAHGEVIDSVRALGGIAQGVGFLGAGIILQAKREVRGLTTAACIWAGAATHGCRKCWRPPACCCIYPIPAPWWRIPRTGEIQTLRSFGQ